MKIKIKLSILLVLAVTSFAFSFAFAEEVKHNFKREISGIDSEWHKLVLPDDIYGKISADLSDLRIIGITAKGDTIEAPYLLRVLEDRVVTEEIPFKIINESHNNQGSFFTFETNSPEAINLINLDFDEKNFDWQLKLEGSQNQQKWFTILEDYRILSIKNELTDFSFTKLTFPDSKYKFYRLFIESSKKPDLIKAYLQKQIVTNGVFHACAINEMVNEGKTKQQQTEILLELEIPLPVSRVKLEVNNKFDYYRPITIKYMADSLKSDNGWKYIYRNLTSGTLNSFEESEFKFKNRTIKKLKIIINNHDNQPLDIETIQVKGYRHELIARFTEPAEYLLIYGNEKLTQPIYDIAHFQDKIPADLKELVLGEEEIVEHDSNEKTALFKNKLWLWGIMILMILLLGFVSVRMIRER